MNLADLLARTVATNPDRIALRLGGDSVTYAELDAASGRVAGLLASKGVGPGDTVGLMLPNTFEFAFGYYGILRAGAIVVPMNPLLKPREVDFYLADSGAKVLVDSKFLVGLDDFVATPSVVARDAEDTAVILYTSGTTGKPKGAELTHGNLASNADAFQGDLLHLTQNDVVFGGLPLFHSFGQTCTLNATMAAGASLVLLPRFDAATALQQLAEHRATIFAGVPTMYTAFLAVPDPVELPDLRMCVSGGAALPVEVLRQFDAEFGCEVLEGYGLSETSPVASFNRPGGLRKPGSIGLPVTGVEMRIVDDAGQPVATGEVGEIAIRGHNVMKGYWQRPEATAEVLSADGWFRTGDVGKADKDGFFFVVDRKKDLVIRGGFNVYPREIEEVFYEHPDVAEVAVIGVPHDELGEEIAAAVSLRPGAAVTAEALRAWVKDQVAPYKYPRHVWFVDALPKGSTGKIQKRDIVIPAEITDLTGATR